MKELTKYLVEQNINKIDELKLQKIITKIKELENTDEANMEGDEYIDAFEALGGGPGREGTVQKDVLIEIITMEFQLTVDMEVSLTSVSF